MKFSLGGGVVLAFLCGAFSWLCFWAAFFVEPRERSGRYGWLTSLNVETHGWLFLILFSALGICTGLGLLLSIWRFFIDTPALAIGRRTIDFHRSIFGALDSIAYSDVQKVIFARKDKLPKSVGENIAIGLPGGWGANMGAKCRSGLRIYYRDRYKNKYITITDNLVEGGETALIQFGATLRLLLRKRDIKFYS